MKTSKLWVLFILYASLAISISAQNQYPFSGSLLWKISGKDLSHESYILGTHHLIHGSFADSIPGIKTALNNTNQVVGEVVMTNDEDLSKRMRKAAVLPPEEAYNKLLSPKDYNKLDSGLRATLGVGIEQFEHLKPGMVSIIYFISLYTKLYPELNRITHEGIDTYMQRIAQEKNKPILGLETVDEQIYALFDAESQKKQAEILVCMISSNDALKDTLNIITQYYREGKLAEMYNLVFKNPEEECSLTNKQEDALMKDRNDKWLKELPEIMKENSSLIVVGSLHLAGDIGLLNQLHKMGYKVEPAAE